MHTTCLESNLIDPVAVESSGAPGATGIAPGAEPEETDPDWQPV
jgi:hypothetical protein